jgi:DNA-binding transcriptional ArsR family regulator
MLLAVAEIAGRSGRCDLIYLSGRELEEVSRISRGTLRRSLLPLAQDLGWLVRVQKGEGAMAPVFDLRVPEDVALWDDPGSWGEHSDLAEREGSVLGVLGGCVCGSDTPLTLHDAFAPGGLTPAAAEVMELLSAVEPSTPKNLADRSGRHVRTVQRALTALRESGLVERIEGGWVRRDRDLEEVASEVGTLGRTTIIRSRHIAQRADFAELRKRQRSTGTEG